MASIPLRLSNIQGNILGGFNKDYQDFLLLSFTSPSQTRIWLREITDKNFYPGLANSTSRDVLRFNAQFKALRIEGIKPEEVITSEWTHLGISFNGFKALGISSRDLARFPKAFRDGMAQRKHVLGDWGANDPVNWPAQYKSGDIHALLIVAADTESQVDSRVNALMASDNFKRGVRLIKREPGRTRKDERGHEHFGFKDGISQPGIRGITPPTDVLGNPCQGQPGQYLLWPGEFVLGYPTQLAKPKRAFDGPNPEPGPLSKSGPRWTRDGSYLVFRRITQDVPGFRRQINALASAHGHSEDVISAKLMGRYKSGYPLMQCEFHRDSNVPPGADPGNIFPQLNESHLLNNNFNFSSDPTGSICPLASHIRKANPRDAICISEVQKRRFLRRGIPFGASFEAPHTVGKADDERGLLFVCYQKDIEQQYEFVQSQWLNDPNFPPSDTGARPGPDPIAAVTHGGTFNLDPKKPNIHIQHFVKVTGGEYFFAASLDALRKLGLARYKAG